jgi:hypothetical protein
VENEAGVGFEPARYGGMIGGSLVVLDQMQIEIARGLAINPAQELEELPVAAERARAGNILNKAWGVLRHLKLSKRSGETILEPWPDTSPSSA